MVIPMNAMSYFTSLERHGWYLRRPNVEIPEKTESACININFRRNIIHRNWISHLCSAITRKSVVPKTLMWTSQWLLVVAAVRCYCSYKAQKCGSEPHLAKVLSNNGGGKNKIVEKEAGFKERETAVNSRHESRIHHYQLYSDEVALGKLTLHE